jgi:flavin-dependent dehydrogenase
MAAVDVAVLGGGPAGLAAAIVSAQRGLRVAVVDRARTKRPVGETLGPEVKALLRSIGADRGFDELPAVPFVGTRSVWGSDDPFDRSAIMSPLGEGLHVDRASFDAWLTARAVDQGVAVETTSARVDVGRSPSGWTIASASAAISSKFLIDARGRVVPRGLPARRWVAFDRLVGVVGWMKLSDASSLADATAELLIEAIPSGWWYSARQPDGGLVATLMTDADLLSGAAREGLDATWRAALAAAPLTSERLAAAALTQSLEVRRAESGFSLPDRGDDWRAVGDAATAWDPLAGTGVLRALSSGIEAAREISAELAGGAATSPASPPFEYLEARARYYQFEQRFRSSLFWARRQPIDLAKMPLFLAPDAMLRAGAEPASPVALAPVEALVPPRAMRDLLRRLRDALPAHVALSYLRERSGPLGDRRLLGAMQLLIVAGAIRVGG